MMINKNIYTVNFILNQAFNMSILALTCISLDATDKREWPKITPHRLAQAHKKNRFPIPWLITTIAEQRATIDKKHYSSKHPRSFLERKLANKIQHMTTKELVKELQKDPAARINLIKHYKQCYTQMAYCTALIFLNCIKIHIQKTGVTPQITLTQFFQKKDYFEKALLPHHVEKLMVTTGKTIQQIKNSSSYPAPLPTRQSEHLNELFDQLMLHCCGIEPASQFTKKENNLIAQLTPHAQILFMYQRDLINATIDALYQSQNPHKTPKKGRLEIAKMMALKQSVSNLLFYKIEQDILKKISPAQQQRYFTQKELYEEIITTQQHGIKVPCMLPYSGTLPAHIQIANDILNSTIEDKIKLCEEEQKHLIQLFTHAPIYGQHSQANAFAQWWKMAKENIQTHMKPCNRTGEQTTYAENAIIKTLHFDSQSCS